MARKVLKYKITDAGRDFGKVFVLTEMPARLGHQWATRALFAVMNGGIEIPENILSAGFAGIAAVGIKALGRVSVEVADPLLQQLMECVQILPDPTRPEVMRTLVVDDIEEVKTIFLLQKEVLTLHIDFFTPAKPTISGPIAA
ncbi:MAG: hypothetical protein JWP38_3744 [Herbaspirillum sp.]|nr:hypothetical protein [Herbaspirillum sp.]